MRNLARNTRWSALCAFFMVVFIGTGCESSDAGVCCKVLPGGDSSLIPDRGETVDGQTEDVLVQNAQFDCSGLLCVSYQGSPAYCTHLCQDATDCPDGYNCEPLLESDPPPGSQLSRTDTFCVRALDQCREE